MKKLFTIILALALLSVAAMPSLAQGRDRRINSSNRTYYGNQTRTSRINNSRSYYDYGNRDRSSWDQHRDKVTVVGGTVGGAIIGGLIGGKGCGDGVQRGGSFHRHQRRESFDSIPKILQSDVFILRVLVVVIVGDGHR